MALRDYYNIILLMFCALSISFAQTTDVRCINPEFDQLVDNYLEYSIPVISVADASETKKNVIFLDARELKEYNTSHIENAIHIGYDKFDISSIKGELPENATFIVYCSIGYRSEKIGEILKANGFHKVYNLYGSIFEWVNQHHLLVDENGNQTFMLHTYNKKWSKWVENDDIKKIW